MKLHYIGDGRYLHEDASVGIPPIPPTDFETDDPRIAAIAVESGLYTTSEAGAETPPPIAEPAPEEEPTTTDDPAPTPARRARRGDET